MCFAQKLGGGIGRVSYVAHDISQNGTSSGGSRRARDSGESNEALWGALLAGHFGRASWTNDRSEQSAGRFLCAFGSRPRWTWQSLCQDFDGFHVWLDQQDEVGNLTTLGFGNHRKYRSK